MGYWKTTMERFGVQDYLGRPWAQLLQASLAEVEPKTLEELEASGDLSSFLSVNVHECMTSIDAMQKQGMDYEVAKECAFDSMLPKPMDVIEHWEEEGSQQYMLDAFGDWIGHQEFD